MKVEYGLKSIYLGKVKASQKAKNIAQELDCAKEYVLTFRKSLSLISCATKLHIFKLWQGT